MAQPELNQRLTTMDASFLYFEKKEAPLHIGGIHVFDGEIPFETFREMVDAKLPLLPRYRQKVIPAPLNLGHPTWEFDPNFDIERPGFGSTTGGLLTTTPAASRNSAKDWSRNSLNFSLSGIPEASAAMPKNSLWS